MTGISDAVTSIAPDIWHVRGEPIRLPGGVRLPLASTLIRLPDRSLLLYSPVKLDDQTAAAIAAHGEVAHIVAPSLLHHLYVKPALERFPRAILYGAPGLAAKRTDLTIQRELPATDTAWDDAIDVVVIAGAPRINEAVLFHRPSGTLVCADLAFNVTDPANLQTRIVLAMMGVGGRRLAQSRVWKVSVRDRTATRASLDRVLRWPVQRVAPVHGAVVPLDKDALAPLVARAYGRRPQPELAAV